MKSVTAVALAIQLLGSFSLAAQETPAVDFRNDRMFSIPADRLVRDSSGTPLVGENYLAQLHYGPVGASESSLNPVTAAPASFRPATTDRPGTWNGGYRVLSGFFAGQTVTLQVRVWDGSLADSYDEAVNLGAGQYGKSLPFSFFIPPPTPPPFFWYIENFRGFTLVPEPSLIGLAVLGFIGLWLVKRRA